MNITVSNFISNLIKKGSHLFHLSFWGFVEAFAGPITTIILMPLLIKNIGYEDFGLWSLTIGFTAFGSLVSFGMSSSLTFEASKNNLLKDRDVLVNSFRTCFTITSISCLFFSLIVIVFSKWISEAFFYDNSNVKSIRIGIIYAALLIFSQELDILISGFFKGLLLYKKNSVIEVFFRILILVVLGLLALNGFGVLMMLKFMLLMYCMKLFVKMILTRNILGDKCFIPLFDRGHIKKVFNFGFWIWIQVIGAILLSFFDRSIVASNFGLKQVAIFSVALSLAQFLHTLTATSLQFIFPKISSWSQDDITKNKDKLIAITFFGFLLISLVFIFVLLICPIIFNLWLGKTFNSEDIYLSRALIFSYGLIAVSVPAHYVLMGLRKTRYIAFSNIIAGGITLLFSFYFASRGLIYFGFSKSVYGFILFSHFIAVLYYVNKKEVF